MMGKMVTIKWVSGTPVKVELCQIKIKSKWNDKIITVLIDTLPIKQVSLFLGNDVGSGEIEPKHAGKSNPPHEIYKNLKKPHDELMAVVTRQKREKIMLATQM